MKFQFVRKLLSYSENNHRTYCVLLNKNGRFQSEFLLQIDVVTNVTELLFHQTYGLKVRRMVECIAT